MREHTENYKKQAGGIKQEPQSVSEVHHKVSGYDGVFPLVPVYLHGPVVTIYSHPDD